MSPESENRRSVERHTAWFPVRIVGEAAQGSALARNVSETGMLVATRKQFEVGDSVEIALLLAEGSDPKGPPSSLRGTIVRSGRNEEDPGGLWPYKVAISFEQPSPNLVPRVTS